MFCLLVDTFHQFSEIFVFHNTDYKPNRESKHLHTWDPLPATYQPHLIHLSQRAWWQKEACRKHSLHLPLEVFFPSLLSHWVMKPHILQISKERDSREEMFGPILNTSVLPEHSAAKEY